MALDPKLLTIIALALLIAGLVFKTFRPSLVFFLSYSLLYILGVTDEKSYLEVFINPSLIALVLLLLATSILENCSIIDSISDHLFKPSIIPAKIRLFGLSALMSFFLNNTAVVSTFFVLMNRQASKKYSAQYILPLVQCVSVAGTVTLIGTSTNLILNGMLIGENLAPIKMFDLTPIGVVLTVLTIIYSLGASKFLFSTSKQATNIQKSKYFIEATVDDASPLIGKTIAENRLRNLKDIFLAEIIRNEDMISPVAPSERIQPKDILIFTGNISKVKLLEQFKGLSVLGDYDNNLLYQNLREVVISHTSSLIGQKIAQINFRSAFDAAVVAISRGTEQIHGGLGQFVIQTGDKLILAVGADFDKLNQTTREFYIATPLKLQSYVNGHKSTLAVVLFFCAIISNLFGLTSLMTSFLTLICLYALLGLASFDDMKRKLNIDIYILAASAMGLSQAIMSTGLAQTSMSYLQTFLPTHNPLLHLVFIYIVTIVVKQFLTNNATVILMFPFALFAAKSIGVSYLPFVMAVCYASSASFLSPFCYQTNMMAYATGEYTVKDFVKFGMPLLIVFSIVVLTLVPHFFPF